MPASSMQACPRLPFLHDVCEHVRDDRDALLPPFCGCDCDHGRNVCAREHVLRHRHDHRVCDRGCDPQCISMDLMQNYETKNRKQ